MSFSFVIWNISFFRLFLFYLLLLSSVFHVYFFLSQQIILGGLVPHVEDSDGCAI